LTNLTWYDILATMMTTDNYITSVTEYTKVLEMVKVYNRTNCKYGLFYKLGILKNRQQLHVKTARVDVERNRVIFRIDRLHKEKLAGLA